MKLLLFLTVCGGILIATGLLVLYADVCRRLNRIKKELSQQTSEIKRTKQRVKVIEDRDRDASNHVYFCTDNEIEEERPDYSDIKYGGEGI